ncbi:hypothetical protein WOLCODRAFT_154044 [Wolfiporia cocos MD-104 SS10]|uniref:Uncharacterized protein n=1 Tax=Wolfiporia cocos (strain MD-104) TaxID=742152 RepID=A0A2H3JP71_WOLCO|nr:hypothetical protein WOLCODRAFT_154044 [Wolfiporia cocos MD-104 SS10]
MMQLVEMHYVLYNIQATPGEHRLWYSSLALGAVMIYMLNTLMYPSGNFPQELKLTAKVTCWIYPGAECFNGNGSDNSYIPSEDELDEPCMTGDRQGIYFIGGIVEDYRKVRDRQTRGEERGHGTYWLSNRQKVEEEMLTYLYSVRSMNNLYKVFGFCCGFPEGPKTHPTWTRKHGNTLRLEYVRVDVPVDFEFGLDKENIQMQPVVPLMTWEENKLKAPDTGLKKEEHSGLDH